MFLLLLFGRNGPKVESLMTNGRLPFLSLEKLVHVAAQPVGPLTHRLASMRQPILFFGCHLTKGSVAAFRYENGIPAEAVGALARFNYGAVAFSSEQDRVGVRRRTES